MINMGSQRLKIGGNWLLTVICSTAIYDLCNVFQIDFDEKGVYNQSCNERDFFFLKTSEKERGCYLLETLEKILNPTKYINNFSKENEIK